MRELAISVCFSYFDLFPVHASLAYPSSIQYFFLLFARVVALVSTFSIDVHRRWRSGVMSRHLSLWKLDIREHERKKTANLMLTTAALALPIHILSVYISVCACVLREFERLSGTDGDRGKASERVWKKCNLGNATMSSWYWPFTNDVTKCSRCRW